MEIREVNGRFEIKDPTSIRPKKITGTRLATILGKNVWSTPFQAWCEITRAYSKPFEDTKYTLAGKAIEPLQLQYLADDYDFAVTTPTDYYGEDYFSKTHGDFYQDISVFGGMWDGLVFAGDIPQRVIECKTSKRVEDWVGENGELEAPEYYRMQACLYAHLLGVRDVTMIVSFLQEKDYNNLDEFTVNDDNTGVISFDINEYCDFAKDVIEPAIAWWGKHIVNGISPKFDEHKDAEYLKHLRTQTAAKDEEIDTLLEELKQCNSTIEKYQVMYADVEKRATEIKKQLKLYAEENLEDKEYWEYIGTNVTCKLSTSYREKVDSKALKADGLFDKYVSLAPSTRFTVTFQN